MDEYSLYEAIENLVEEISKLNFKYPYIVLAQAILETGNYTTCNLVEITKYNL